MALSENKWFIRFWYEHGDRLIFMGLATMFALGFMVISKYSSLDLFGDAKTILVMVAGIALNKARSVIKKDDNG